MDGLLVLASLALLDPALTRARPWVRVVVRVAFVTGVAVSLAANIAAAGSWTWAAVMVAGWPPLALLLSVEILIHSATRDTPAETRHESAEASGESRTIVDGAETGETVSSESDTRSTGDGGHPGPVQTGNESRRVRRGEAQRVMWEHYRRAHAPRHADTARSQNMPWPSAPGSAPGLLRSGSKPNAVRKACAATCAAGRSR
ncbi:MAG TPA: hypothetical protein VFQ77_06760 [Pseudonocardiaceae bacterium]|nr:hypothetical protein [Pseudonocardiaceae bacterium]